MADEDEALWMKHDDIKTGKEFFHNVATGKTLWQSPDQKWHEAIDVSTGRTYYMNIALQATSWAQPVDYSEEDDFQEEPDGVEVEYEYDCGNEPGKWLPAVCAESGKQYWYCGVEPKPFWSKPKNSKHPHRELPPPKFEDLTSHSTRLLRYAVGRHKDEVSRLRKEFQKLQSISDARYAQITALTRAQKLRGVHNQITHGRTGRHMENQLQQSSIQPLSVTKVRADHSVVSFLKSVPLFHKLDEEGLANVQRCLNHVTFKDGDKIFRQDESTDLIFYLIESGQVRSFTYKDTTSTRQVEAGIAKTASINEGSLKPISRTGTQTASSSSSSTVASTDDSAGLGDLTSELKAGDYFGERELLETANPQNSSSSNKQKKTFRKSTIVAAGPVSCFTLDYDSFVAHIPPEAFAASDAGLTDAKEEIASLSRHINNYEVLLLMKSRAHTQTEKKVADALLGIITAFSPELNVDDTIERMIKTLYSVFECERVSLFYVNWETKKIHFQVSKDDLRQVVLEINQGLVGACVLEDKIINVPDVTKDKRFFGDMDKKSGFRTRTVLCCPVRDGHGIVQAVIQLVNKKGASPFNQDDEIISQSVAEQMALTLAHKKVEMQTDAGDKYLPIWKADLPFRVSIKRFLGASLSKNTVDEIILTVGLYHAGIPLCKERVIQKKAERVAPLMVVKFDEMVEFDIKLCDVPRAARVIYTLHYPQTNEKGEVMRNDPSKGDTTPLKGDIIGWAGATLFNFDQVLRTGHDKVKLFSDNIEPAAAAVKAILSNVSKKDVDIVEVEYPKFEKSVVYTDNPDSKSIPQDKTGNKSKKIDQFIDSIGPLLMNPLQPISDENKELIRSIPMGLVSKPEALPKFLQSTLWNKQSGIQSAYQMLYRWEALEAKSALQLLDFNFPDPKVRAHAVSLLETFTEQDLQLYMLQLTQVLKFEPFIDSALARFLLRRALRSPKTTGQTFFWLLMAEMHVPEVRTRYRVLIDLFLRHCGEYRTALGHQMYVLEKLNQCAAAIKKKAKDKSEAARKLLSGIVFPEKFQLPLNPEVYFKGLRVESCRVMSSKKMPLWLSFQNATPNSPPFTVLYKAGDDLRQDQLTLQVLKVIDQIWKREGLAPCMNVYGCVSTGFEQGMIEVVENSNTIGKITAGKASHFKKFQVILNVYDSKSLKKWLRSKGHPPKVCEQNFLKSCASYCVATYVLGIGDRHNDNIMLKEDGQLFHIDFGHFLGNFKSKMGIKRERAPFIFTPAMAAVLGGTGSTLYKEFEELCCKKYNILRKNSNLLITLFSLMLSCGIPELEGKEDIGWLQEKLMIGATDEVAAKTFKGRIHEALTTRTTQLNDVAHLLKHA